MRSFATIFAPLLVAYWVTLGWIWDMWNFRDAYYAHGPLVVGLAAYLVHARRALWQAVPARVDSRGWLLLGPALGLHLAGAALAIDSLSALSLAAAMPGAVVLAVGAGRGRVLLPVLALLLFAIPTPLVVQSRMAFELKEIAVGAGLALANLLGTGAERLGAEVRVPGQQTGLWVADACSGLRSLVALVTLGYCIAFFMGEQRGPRRWILLLVAGPIAIATNALRIAAICVLAATTGTEFASGAGHDLASGLVWVVALGLLLLVDGLLTRWQRRRSG